jgi:prenyltransferase beta subunit
MVIGQLDGYRHNVLIEALRRRQNELGGFAASSSSIAEADLLTTATALFALHSYRVPPMYDTALFILAHWQDTGGFSATLDSEECDVEYTYYGLLAIGSSII